ncbi:MAG: ATP-grasp domain-containing protein [candidate division KSB1 bacterium]|nr:ATP-grasp domain-containing protein [candidate division KSB1 bacterium]MDZ7346523.1 ATP-grasp domain-containing protein [candidate division KSB1 bacterium]
MTAVVLYNAVSKDSAPDEQDVLVEAAAVSAALQELGFAVELLAAATSLDRLRGDLLQLKPTLIFNLVEAFCGRSRDAYRVAELLEDLGMPFTGGSARGIHLTTDKPRAKTLLRRAGLPTPDWTTTLPKDGRLPFDPPFILKPAKEDASIGIDAAAVCRNKEELAAELQRRQDRRRVYFIEQFIDGREFNVSLLINGRTFEVLPPAEIRFVDYPPDKPRIVDYAAKWTEDSFEYRHTVRSFDFAGNDEVLLAQLNELAVRAAELFENRGYLRVDLRVDTENRPWILEINVNPCISPDAGFAAAAARAGLSYAQLIGRIVENAFQASFPNRRPSCTLPEVSDSASIVPRPGFPGRAENRER